MLETINTLWFGERLRYLEQLSIGSALAQGHPVKLYSYHPDKLEGVPAGVEVADAREVLSDPKRIKLLEGKFKALGSNFFRYEIFQKKLGYWMDLDVILLKPLKSEKDYVFGWEKQGASINTAVMRVPSGSPFLEELRAIPEYNWCPPYFGPKRRAIYYWKRATKGRVELEDLPWGSAGPAMITYLAKKHRVTDEAQPEAAFYPLPYDRAEALFEDASVVESMIRPETVAIHMWNSRLHAWAGKRPPAGSYIDKACGRFGARYDN